jgi:hypothetical protein
VDLLTQSLTFKSVNVRGFGANNNNRFLQLTDGMDNRSPGLGFGFGNAAGVSDLDVESIEILPGRLVGAVRPRRPARAATHPHQKPVRLPRPQRLGAAGRQQRGQKLRAPSPTPT